jgi:hypothetical protein
MKSLLGFRDICLIIMSAAAALATAPTVADCNLNNCDSVTVERLYQHSNGNMYILTSGDERVIAGGLCPAEGLVLAPGVTGGDRMIDLLFGAALAKQPVRIRVQDNTCEVAYVWVTF